MAKQNNNPLFKKNENGELELIDNNQLDSIAQEANSGVSVSSTSTIDGSFKPSLDYIKENTGLKWYPTEGINALNQKLAKAEYLNAKKKADNQGFFGEGAGFLAQAGVGEIVLGTVEGVGYLMDFEHWFDRLSGGEGDWGNWLSDLAVKGKEGVSDWAPIYQDPDNKERTTWQNMIHGDGWWWQNGVSVVSALSLLIPVTGWVKAGGIIGKGLASIARAGKLGKAGTKAISLVDDLVKIAPDVLKTERGKALLGGVYKGIISRHIENHMEAASVYREKYEEFIQKGLSEQEAKKAASEGAALTYNANWAMLITDIPQYLMLGKSFSIAKGITTAKLAKLVGQSVNKTRLLNLGKRAFSFGSEGFEEAYQFIIAEEGKHLADVQAGLVDPNDSILSERLDAYSKDAELWTSAFFGGLGGVVFKAIGPGIQKRVFNKLNDKVVEKNKVASNLVIATERVSQSTREYFDAIELGDEKSANIARSKMAFNIGVQAAIKGNFDVIKQQLEDLKNASPEERKENGFEEDEDFNNNIDEHIKLAEKGAEMFSINKEKYTENTAYQITYNQYMAQYFNNKLPELRKNQDNLIQTIPGINNVTPQGKQAFDNKLLQLGLERYIRTAERKLQNKKLSEFDRKALEDSIKEDSEQLELIKSKFEEAKIIGLNPTDRVAISHLNGGFSDELIKAVSETAWTEFYINKWLNEVNRMTSKEYQQSIKEKEDLIIDRLKQQETSKQAKEKADTEKDIIAKTPKYKINTEESDFTTQEEAPQKLEMSKFHDMITSGQIDIENVDPTVQEAYKSWLSLNDEGFKQVQENSNSNIVEEIPNNPIDEETYLQGSDTFTNSVTQANTPLAYLSVYNNRTEEQDKTESNKALSDFLENNESLEGVYVVFDINTDFLNDPNNRGYKHFNQIKKDIENKVIPTNGLGVVPIKATLYSNNKPIEYNNQNLIMNLHTEDFFEYSENKEYQKNKLLEHKRSIIEAIYFGNKLKANIDYKSNGTIQLDILNNDGTYKQNSFGFELGTSAENITLVYGDDMGTYLTHDKSLYKPLASSFSSAKGAIYAVTKTANGTPFPLRLQSSKITKEEGNLLHSLYTAILIDPSLFEAPLSVTKTGEISLADQIRQADNPRIAGIAKYLNLDKIKYKELISHLVHEGKATMHKEESRLFLQPSKDNQPATLVFGDNIMSVNELATDEGKTTFIEHIIENRNRQVDIKYLDNGEYKIYLDLNRVLSTNAKSTPSKNLFVQPVVTYSDNLESFIETPQSKDQSLNDLTEEEGTDLTSLLEAALAKNSQITIEERTNTEIDDNTLDFLKNIDNITKEAEGDGETPLFKKLIPSSESLFNITAEVEKIRELLPTDIGINITSDYIRVLSQGAVAVGMFKEGMITLASNAPVGTAYHEAFHAVFRTMLTNKQQVSLLADTSSISPNPTIEDIKSIVEDNNVNESEARNIFFEEILADEFAIYNTNPELGNTNTQYSKGIKKFFQKLSDLIRYIFTNEKSVRMLFEDISKSKYKDSIPKVTRGNKQFSSKSNIENIVDYSLKLTTALDKIQRNNFESSKLQGWINDLKKQGINDIQLNMFKAISKDGMSKESIIKAIHDNFNHKITINTLSDYHYDDYTVPGGLFYKENEIAIPTIIPFIKGHADFSTPNGIGWFRSDTAEVNIKSKTRRILEFQSDLFQKGRNRENLVNTNNLELDTNSELSLIKEAYENGNISLEEYEIAVANTKKQVLNNENQFLQLLNKDNNWVTFFIKSIVQDSYRRGFNKILFPVDKTLQKIQGHEILVPNIERRKVYVEEKRKEKNDYSNYLETLNKISDKGPNKKGEYSIPSYLKNLYPLDIETDYNQEDLNHLTNLVEDDIKFIEDDIKNQIRWIQEGEDEYNSKYKPTKDFYDNTVTNILKKQGFNPIIITDEYGNSWNEIEINKNNSGIIVFKKEDIDNLNKKLFPLSTLQKNEITANLTFIGLYDIQELKDVKEQFNVSKVEKQLAMKLKSILTNDKLSEEQKAEYVKRFQYILTSEGKLNPFWKIQVIDYIEGNFGLKKLSKKIDQEDNDLEENESGSNNTFERQSYEESGHLKATTNMKYIVGTIPDIKEFKDGRIIYNTGDFLGLPKFVDSGVIWNSTINALQNIVPIIEENGLLQDPFKMMLIKLQQESKYKPELGFLADKVSKMNSQVQTQFYKTFAQQKGRYIDHIIAGPIGSTISKITDSNSDSKENSIINNWVSIFNNKFGTFENNQLVYDTNSIKEFKDLYEDYINNLKSDLSKKTFTLETKSKLLKSLAYLGVEINPNTIDKILEDTSTITDNLTRAIAYKEFTLRFGAIVKDLMSKKGLLNDKTNLIRNNNTFFKNILASTESYFTKVSGEDSFIGPDGNKTYIMQNHTSMSIRIAEFKNNDLSYLNDLKKSNYNSGSLWLEDLLDESTGGINRQNFYLAPYGNFKYQDDVDFGDKASNLKPSDTFIDHFNKQIQGYFIGLAEADKSQQVYIRGPIMRNANIILNNIDGQPKLTSPKGEVTQIFTKYLAAELRRMYGVWEDMYGENKLADKDLILYYHYVPGADGNKLPGNGFNSFLFPNMNLIDLDLKLEDTNIPSQILPSKLSSENLLADNKITEYVNGIFINTLNKDIEESINNGLIDKNQNKYINRTINLEELNKRGYYLSEDNKSTAIISTIADYTLNSIIGNIEQTMMFNMDPALYKVKYKEEKLEDGSKRRKDWALQDIFADFKKRIPALNASGKVARIYNDENGIPVVREKYTSATIANIETSSKFFGNPDGTFNEENIKLISDTTGETIENIKKLFKPYLNINQTDAQAWITLDAYRERMLAYGDWSNEHQEVYEKIQNNEILSIGEKVLLAQPLKTVHVEAKKHVNGTMNLHYNKQSEAVLLPYLTQGTMIDNLRLAMENNNIDHVIVLDGKKVGATGITNIMDNGKVKNFDKISFNPVELSYKSLFLQQELPPHGIDNRLVGSQAVKNVLATVATDEEGIAFVNEYHSIISKLSDLGLVSLKRKMDYSSEEGFKRDEDGKSALYKTIYGEFYGDLSENHLKAIRDEVAIDSIPIKDKLQNKLHAMITKSAIKLKQLGGALIQTSDLGFVGAEINLSDKVRDGIIWLKDPKEYLKPMWINEEGVKPAQILMPYDKLMSDSRLQEIIKSKYGVTNYKELTHTQIKDIISSKVLEGFSYRIPNQGPSSNDAFEIVGILPPEMGDTMISFSDITTKTGSDFDIDKSFVILPNFYFDKRENRIKKVKYDPNNETKEGLENKRLEMMRQMLMNPNAYMSVMAPLDDPWLEDLAKDLYPDRESNEDLNFFRGFNQMNIKNVFDTAKSLVGVIANHMSNNSLFLHEGVSFKDYYIGKGNKVIPSIIEVLPEAKYTFEDDQQAYLEIENNEIPSGTIIRLEGTSQFHKNISTTGLYEVYIESGEDMDLLPINNLEQSNTEQDNSSSLSNRFDESGNKIENTLGVFMNAIVDAAKDPYIARANINQFTAGTAFMLSRAGVDREWIVSFMGQPIIQQLIEETNKLEGRFAKDVFENGKKLKAIDIVLKNYKHIINGLNERETNIKSGKFNLKNTNNEITISTKYLKQMINNYTNPEVDIWTNQELLEDQLAILGQFMEWQQKAKQLGQLIKLSKADVEGATRNLNRAKLYMNLYNKFEKENPFNGVDNLLGFNGDSTNMIATYIKNGVEAAREMYKPLFLASSEASEYLVDLILKNSGYIDMLPTERNEVILDQVSNEVYAMLVSQLDALSISSEELSDILFGHGKGNTFGDLRSSRTNDLATRINNAKNAGLKQNALINSLQTIVANKQTEEPCKITLPKNDLTKQLKDDFYIAWEELLQIDEPLGLDLIKYAFYSTGFTGTSGFYEHIPQSVLEKYNFSDQIKSLNTILNNNPNYLNDKIDYIFKNLWYINELVPIVNNKNISMLADLNGTTYDSKVGFILTEDSGNGYIAGEDANGSAVYKRFVKKERILIKDPQTGEVIKSTYDLYQLQGYTNDGKGAVYINTNRLGYKEKGKTVKEYTNDNTSNISMFKNNNVSLPEEINKYLLGNENLKIPVTTYNENKKEEYKVDPDIESRLNFCLKS